MSDGVFIQFMCQIFNLTGIQIEVCQKCVYMVFVNSPRYSNKDHVYAGSDIRQPVKPVGRHSSHWGRQ